jgi:hypothetical protein
MVRPYILQIPLYRREEGFSEAASLFCVKYAGLQIRDWFSSYKCEGHLLSEFGEIF